jgi:hypothetical protein
MNALFLSYNSLKGKTTGGSLVATRNSNYFKNFDGGVFKLELFDSNDILLQSRSLRGSFLSIFKNIVHFQTLSFNHLFLELLFKKINENKIVFIFLDSTLFGSIAKKIKKNFPNVKIIIYAHNVELISSWHSFIYEFSLKKIYLLLFSYINETRSCTYSDFLIGISSFDQKSYERLYNRKFNCIIPVTISESNKVINNKIESLHGQSMKILFIGSNFYPNIHGLRWFIENVLNNINADLIVVGAGMSSLKKKYKNISKIQFFDYVDDLGYYYKSCDIVISPIFLGSGMKVKIAEALKYGKFVLGTSLSFQGYEISNSDCHICNSKADFINKINFFEKSLRYQNKYSSKSHNTYLEYYSSINEDYYFLPVINFIKNIYNE